MQSKRSLSIDSNSRSYRPARSFGLKSMIGSSVPKTSSSYLVRMPSKMKPSWSVISIKETCSCTPTCQVQPSPSLRIQLEALSPSRKWHWMKQPFLRCVTVVRGMPKLSLRFIGSMQTRSQRLHPQVSTYQRDPSLLEGSETSSLLTSLNSALHSCSNWVLKVLRIT